MKARTKRGLSNFSQKFLACAVTISMVISLSPASSVLAYGQSSGSASEASPFSSASSAEVVAPDKPTVVTSEKAVIDDSEEVVVEEFENVEPVVEETPKFVVTFNPTDATDGEMESQELEYTGKAVLSPNAFTRTDYKFIGWSTTPDNKDIKDDPSTKDIDESVKAILLKDEQKMTDLKFDYDMNGDGVIGDKNDSSVEEKADLSVYIKHDAVTLYAQWELTDEAKARLAEEEAAEKAAEEEARAEAQKKEDEADASKSEAASDKDAASTDLSFGADEADKSDESASKSDENRTDEPDADKVLVSDPEAFDTENVSDAKDSENVVTSLEAAEIGYPYHVIVASSSSADVKPYAVLGNHDDTYLLGFANEEDAAHAVVELRAKDSVEFAVIDRSVSAADDESVNEISTTAFSVADNPVAALNDIETDSVENKNVIALVDTGAPKGKSVIASVSVLGEDASDVNGHAARMVQAMKDVDEGVQVYAIKALGDDGVGSISSVYAAIEAAIAADVKVIVLPLSAYATSENVALTEAINDAREAGIIVVGAAGNDGIDAKYVIPGSIDAAFITGACDSEGIIVESSNFGKTVDVDVVAHTTSEASAKAAAWIAQNSTNETFEKDVADQYGKGLFFSTDAEAMQTEQPEVVEPENGEVRAATDVPFTLYANGGEFGDGTTTQTITINDSRVWVGSQQYAHSDNITDAGVVSGQTGHNLAQTKEVKVEGAASLDVHVWVDTESTNYDWLCIYDGTVTPNANNYTSSISGKLGNQKSGASANNYTTWKDYTYTIPGDTVRFFYRTDTSVGSNGYYAIVESVSGSVIVPTYDANPTWEQHVFLGWNTAQDGSGATFSDVESAYITGATALYAQWASPSECWWIDEAGTTLYLGTPFEGTPTAQGTLNLAGYNSYQNTPWYNYRTQITKVVLGSDMAQMTSAGYLFGYMTALQEVETQDGFSGFDNVQYYYSMFQNDTNLRTVDMEGWDFSHATNFSQMFYYCQQLTSLDVTGMVTPSTQSIGTMFQYCSRLTTLTGIETWQPTNLSTGTGAFQSCSQLTGIDVSDWRLPKLTYASGMFQSCQALTELDTSDWGVGSGITTRNSSDMGNYSSMFYGCSNLQTLDMSSWRLWFASNTNQMFAGCTRLQTIDASGWQLGQYWTNAANMFYNCSSLTTLNMGTWHPTALANTSYMFYNCSQLAQIDAGVFSDNGFTNVSYMFQNCASVEFLDVSAWDMTTVTNATSMFSGCTSLKAVQFGSDWRFGYNKTINAITSNGTPIDMTIQTANWNGGSFPTYISGNSEGSNRWTISSPGASHIAITFDSATRVPTSYAGIVVYKTSNAPSSLSYYTTSKPTNAVEFFTGTAAAGKTVVVEGDSATIMLVNYYESSSTYKMKATAVADPDVEYSSSYGGTFTLPAASTTSPYTGKWILRNGDGTSYTETEVTALDDPNADPAYDFTGMWMWEGGAGYSLTFDANGHGTAPGGQFLLGDALPQQPADPATTGYRFGGWFEEPECETPFDFTSPLTQDMVVYAKWDAHLVLNGNGGTFANSSSVKDLDLTDTRVFSSDYTVTHSPNVTDEGVATSNTGTYQTYTSTGTYPGATQLFVDFYYNIGTADAYAAVYDDMSITPSGSNVGLSLSGRLNQTGSGTTVTSDYTSWRNKQYYVDGDSIQVLYYPYYQASKGYYARLYSVTGDVTIDTPYEEPINPTGVFLGWNTAADGSGQQFTSLSMAYKNGYDTLYAQWGDVGKVWYITSSGDLHIGASVLPNDVVYSGTFNPETTYSYSSVPWYQQRALIQRAIVDDTCAHVTSTAYWFYTCTNLEYADFSNLGNMSDVTNTSYMFYNCTSLQDADLSGFGSMSDVTNTSYMFSNCTSLMEVPDAVNWNLNNVTNAASMFNGCSLLLSLDGGSWGLQSLENGSNMFGGCKSIMSLNAHGWRLDNLTNAAGMFYGNNSQNTMPNLSYLDTSTWGAMDNLQNGNWMFGGLTSVAPIDTSAWHLSSLTNGECMFNNLPRMTIDTSNFDLHSLTTATNMFYNVSPSDLDMNVTNITTANGMFIQSTQPNAMWDFSGWDMSHTTGSNSTTQTMLPSYTAVKTLKLGPNWSFGSGMRAGDIVSGGTLIGTYNTPNFPDYYYACQHWNYGNYVMHGTDEGYDRFTVTTEDADTISIVFDSRCSLNGTGCLLVYGGDKTVPASLDYIANGTAESYGADELLTWEWQSGFNKESVTVQGPTATVVVVSSVSYGQSGINGIKFDAIADATVESHADAYKYFMNMPSSMNTTDAQGYKWYNFDTGESYTTAEFEHLKAYASSNYDYTGTWHYMLDGDARATLSFDMNGHGTQITDEVIAVGESFTAPSDPTAEGYRFLGWYTDEECTKPYTFGTEVTSSGTRTVYAKWQAMSDGWYVADTDDDGVGDTLYIGTAAPDSDPSVVGQGTFTPSGYNSAASVPWNTYAATITSAVVLSECVDVTSTAHWFEGMSNLTDVGVLGLGDMSKVTSTNSMFKGCVSLEAAPVSDWAMSSVTDISGMFENCSSLNVLGTSTWDLSSVTDASRAFYGCGQLSEIESVNWHLTSLENASGMFRYCYNLEEIDTSGWGTMSALKDGSGMFYGCSALESLNTSTWSFASLENASHMFDGCVAITNLDLSSATSSSVYGAAANEGLDGMFNGMTGLQSIKFSGLFALSYPTTEGGSTTSSYPALLPAPTLTGKWVKLDGSMEAKTPAEMAELTASDLRGVWVQDGQVYHTVTFEMNGHGRSLTPLRVIDGGYATAPSKPTAADARFSGWYADENLTTPFDFDTTAITSDTTIYAKWLSYSNEWYIEDTDGNGTGDKLHIGAAPPDGATVTNQGTYTMQYGQNQSYPPWNSYMTNVTEAIVEPTCLPVQTCNYWFGTSGTRPNLQRVDMSGFDCRNVVSMLYMFSGCTGLTEIVMPTDGDFHSVKNASYAFSKCSSLTSLDVSGWHTPYLKQATAMFSGCTNLRSIDLSNWKPTNVSSVDNMFSNDTSLTMVDMTDWGMSSVSSLDSMFASCTNLVEVKGQWSLPACSSLYRMCEGDAKLERIDVSKWGLGNCQSWYRMFSGCAKLDGLDVSGWNPVKLTNSEDAFNACASWSYADVSNWNLASLQIYNHLFYGCRSLVIEGLENWDTSGATAMYYVFCDCDMIEDTASLGVENWDVSNCQNLYGMFQSCNGLLHADLSNWYLPKVAHHSSMFNSCDHLLDAKCPYGVNTDSAGIMDYFYGCTSLKYFDASGFNLDEKAKFRINGGDYWSESWNPVGGLYALESFKVGEGWSFGGNFYDVYTLTDGVPVATVTGASWTDGTGHASTYTAQVPRNLDGSTEGVDRFTYSSPGASGMMVTINPNSVIDSGDRLMVFKTSEAPASIEHTSTGSVVVPDTCLGYIHANQLNDSELAHKYPVYVEGDSVTLILATASTRYTTSAWNENGFSATIEAVGEDSTLTCTSPKPFTWQLPNISTSGNSTLTGKWVREEDANDPAAEAYTSYELSRLEDRTHHYDFEGTWVRQERSGSMVSFVMNGHGTQVQPMQVALGEKIPEPTVARVDGYTLVGWYKDSQLTQQWNFATDEAWDDEITLYAKWELSTYTVTVPKQVTFSDIDIGEVDISYDTNVTVTGENFGTVTVSSTDTDAISAGGERLELTSSTATTPLTFTQAGTQVSTVSVTGEVRYPDVYNGVVTYTASRRIP